MPKWQPIADKFDAPRVVQWNIRGSYRRDTHGVQPVLQLRGKFSRARSTEMARAARSADVAHASGTVISQGIEFPPAAASAGREREWQANAAQEYHSEEVAGNGDIRICRHDTDAAAGMWSCLRQPHPNIHGNPSFLKPSQYLEFLGFTIFLMISRLASTRTPPRNVMSPESPSTPQTLGSTLF